MTRGASLAVRTREIRLQGELAGWSVERIVAVIRAEFPEITLLWARRLAHGWTRPQLLGALVEMYHSDGLIAPAIRTSELCRWEKGQHVPNEERRDYLCRVYRTRPHELGFGRDHSPKANGADAPRVTTRASQEVPASVDLVTIRLALELSVDQARQLRQALDDAVLEAERMPTPEPIRLAISASGLAPSQGCDELPVRTSSR